MDKDIPKIKELLKEKSKEYCGGKKWEINNNIYIELKQAKQFFNNLIKMFREFDINNAINTNKIFNELINNEFILNNYGNNLKEFLIKFKGIISDFCFNLNLRLRGK